MSAILSLIFIGVLAFSAFCFYCGINAIGEKLKKDGLYPVMEIALITFLATALVMLAVGKVSTMLFTPTVIQVQGFKGV